MFNIKSRIEEAIAILRIVEKDTWLLNWTADQEQDLAEALNRLTFLHQSLETVHKEDIEVANQSIAACK